MRKFVAYYRVSTTRQGKSGLGLDGQVAAVHAHVRERGGELVASFTEIESGRRIDRPRLTEARELAAKSGAVLLIAKLDRLARSVHFIASIMLDNVEIEACDMPAANRMTLHIMAAIAEGEAEAISARTKAALQQAALRGRKFGFAHEANRDLQKQVNAMVNSRSKIEADQFAARMGPVIEEMRDAGMTYEQIARKFKLFGVAKRRTVKGVPQAGWSVSRIFQVYKRYRFIGPPRHGYAALPHFAVDDEVFMRPELAAE